MTAREIICELIYCVPGCSVCEENQGESVDKVLTSLRELVKKEKNMPEIMLSEYGKGENAALDRILELLK